MSKDEAENVRFEAVKLCKIIRITIKINIHTINNESAVYTYCIHCIWLGLMLINVASFDNVALKSVIERLQAVLYFYK